MKMAASRVSCPGSGLNQVQERIQENPDDIDKVPVQAHVLDVVRVAKRGAAAEGAIGDDRQQHHTDNHVQRVQTGHRKVQHEEHLHVLANAGVAAVEELGIVPAEDRAGDQVLNEI